MVPGATVTRGGRAADDPISRNDDWAAAHPVVVTATLTRHGPEIRWTKGRARPLEAPTTPDER